MTLEEHIENLKAIASDMPSDKCSDWIESLMAGVKALEQEPCCNCIEFKRYAKEMGFEIEQEPIFDKPHIKGDYYDGFKSGLRTAKWRNDKIRAEIRAEIEQFAKNPNFGDLSLGASCGAIKALEIIDKYKAEGSEE